MNNSTSWVLDLYTAEMREPLQIRLNDELIVGRADPSTPDSVDVDLSPYGAAQQGVSRQHLVIHVDKDQLMITDLNSNNGTLLNNKRLVPNEAYHLSHEDEIQLGAMPLEVRVVAAPTYENMPRRQTSVKRKSSEKPGNGELVLIVEDHVEVAQLFSLMLQRQGFATQISRDVTRAIRLFEQKQPAAIILDLMLPGVDGLELCRYVRRDVELDSTPIIVVSANKTQDTMDEVLKAGADIYLTKPLNASELGDVVADLIEKKNVKTGPLTDGDALVTKHLGDSATARALNQREEVRDDSVAIVIAGYSDAPLTLNLRKPMSFGRTSNGTSNTHVDLSRYDAAELGVSRMHMYMHHRDKNFFVEDAGSLNGTFINGVRIPENKLEEIQNGDEIRLGQLRMYVYFLTDTRI